MNAQTLLSTYRELAKGVDLPAAFLDKAFFEENLNAILHRAKGKKIRVATKSIRSIGVLKEILGFDSAFQGVMCFTLQEACYLMEQGFTDILMGYPDVQKKWIKKALCLSVEKNANMVFMTDLIAHIEYIESVAQEINIKAKICVDIDMSISFPGLWFGVYRSSIRDNNGLEKYLQALEKTTHIHLVGLMGYEAQVAGLGDKGMGVTQSIIRRLKKISIPKIRERRTKAIDLIEQTLQQPLEIINAGGTGSIESSKEESKVTEITVGSGIYSSHLFDYFVSFQHKPALFYATQMVRRPEKNIYTAHGGGYIASGSVESTKAPVPYLNQLKLFKNEGMGEVQTPFLSKEKFILGDPVFFRHAKAGELLERFNTIHVIEGDKITKTFSSYRGDGQCFL